MKFLESTSKNTPRAYLAKVIDCVEDSQVYSDFPE